jgi:hypothetical protein
MNNGRKKNNRRQVGRRIPSGVHGNEAGICIKRNATQMFCSVIVAEMNTTAVTLNQSVENCAVKRTNFGKSSA